MKCTLIVLTIHNHQILIIVNNFYYLIANFGVLYTYVQIFEVCDFRRSSNFSGFIFEDQSFFTDITY